MAEHKPLVAAEAPRVQDVYRPLSGLAVAALIVALGYAALIGVVGVVALTSGMPLFLALWTLLIPATGIVLAFVARRQMRQADGIRGGRALTTWALWLCGIFGLGYFAYYMGTRAAVTWQANNFTNRWLEKLRDGKFNTAFMDTLTPKTRKHSDAPDFLYVRYGINVGRQKGPLLGFQENEVVRIFEEWKRDAEVSPVGVKNWEYDKDGFVVTQTYRLKTPEAENLFDVVVRSSEGPDIEGRQWHVDQRRVDVTAKTVHSDFGQTLDRWRERARPFAGEWIRKRFNGESIGAYIDTLPPSERPQRQRDEIGLIVAGFAAQPTMGLANLYSLLPTDGRALLTWPGFRDFTAGKLIKADGFMAVPRVRADMLATIDKEFGNTNWAGVRIADRKPQVRIADKQNGPVQVLEQVDWAITPPNPPPGAMPLYTIEANLVLESDVGPITRDRVPQWRVVAFQLLRGTAPSPERERIQ